MPLLDRSTALAAAAMAALSSPRVRETLREGAVQGLAYSMTAADAIAQVGRGAWEGARDGYEASQAARRGEGARRGTGGAKSSKRSAPSS
jgi:hypothetical protein